MSNTKIYNLRIVPPQPILGEIGQLKKQFIAEFGKQPLSKSVPHITLAVFEMDLDYHGSAIRIFDQLSDIKGFDVNIDSFGIFENKSHVLYLKVLDTEEIAKIQTRIKVLWLRDFHRKLASLKTPGMPHITISKTAGKKMLFDSLAFFEEKGYSRKMEVNRLTLVSRYRGKTWDFEHHIPLLGNMEFLI